MICMHARRRVGAGGVPCAVSMTAAWPSVMAAGGSPSLSSRCSPPIHHSPPIATSASLPAARQRPQPTWSTWSGVASPLHPCKVGIDRLKQFDPAESSRSARATDLAACRLVHKRRRTLKPAIDFDHLDFDERRQTAPTSPSPSLSHSPCIALPASQKKDDDPHARRAIMSPSTAQWHSVSPHTRPLSIAILELAPTSVTLALTRSPPGNNASPSGSNNHHHAPAQHVVHSLSHHQSHSHQHHGHAGSSSHANNSSGKKKKKKRGGGASGGNLSVPHGADSEDGGDDGDEDGTGPHGFIPGAYPFSSMLADGQTFKDMLSHGVVITVDGMPWSRIVAHVSDDADDEEGFGAGTNGDGEDEDGDWEDEWEHAGNDEDESNVPGVATVARRRRGHRQSAGASDAHRPHTKPTRSHAAHEKPPRWDRERAVVVVYDLDPSKEHEIELQIVGLVSEAKELGKCLCLGSADQQCLCRTPSLSRQCRRRTRHCMRAREPTHYGRDQDQDLDQTRSTRRLQAHHPWDRHCCLSLHRRRAERHPRHRMVMLSRPPFSALMTRRRRRHDTLSLPPTPSESTSNSRSRRRERRPSVLRPRCEPRSSR